MDIQMLSRILSSNFPTILSVAMCMALIAYYWYIQLPKLEEKDKKLAELEEENERLKAEAGQAQPLQDNALSDMLQALDEAVSRVGTAQQNSELTPEFKQVWMNLMKQLDRNLNLIRHEVGMVSENINEILSENATMRSEVSEFRRQQQILLQRHKELANAIYAHGSPRNPEGFNDLRELG